MIKVGGDLKDHLLPAPQTWAGTPSHYAIPWALVVEQEELCWAEAQPPRAFRRYADVMVSVVCTSCNGV